MANPSNSIEKLEISNSCENEMAELPEDVITDILVRLPVISLLRFRRVSKSFCAQIDSPKFIKRHLSQSLKTKTNHTVILQDSYDVHSADLNKLDQTQNLHHPLKPEKKEVILIGSTNGLVCLYNSEVGFAIWNLATRTYQKFSIPEFEFPGPPTKSYQFNYGFGYDSVSDDYKLLRLAQFYGEDFDSFKSESKVYSLKSNSWQKIQDCPYWFSVKQSHRLFQAACGRLHWFVSLTNEFDSYLIASFNLSSNKYMLIDQPDIRKKGFDLNLGELEGNFCIMCNYNNAYIDFWVMKNYGVKDSWRKLFSISRFIDILPFKSIIPLAYSKKGDEILLVLDYDVLFWYNLEDGEKRMVNLRGRPKNFLPGICVENLVRLSGKAEDYALKPKGEGVKKKQSKSRKKRDDFLSQGFKLVL